MSHIASATPDEKLVDIDSLSNAALAWAVCLAMGETPKFEQARFDFEVRFYDDGPSSWQTVRLDDQEAGEISDRYWVGVERPSAGQATPTWRAISDFKGKAPPFTCIHVVSASAPDRKTAIFRAFVKSRFNEKISIPAALLVPSEPKPTPRSPRP